jgi:Rieske Fe-S protein
LPIAILVPIRIGIENPQICPSWESSYDSDKRENALIAIHDDTVPANRALRAISGDEGAAYAMG